MINREKLKKALESKTRAWLKSVVGMSILFCGGFDAWVEHLQKTERKNRKHLIYGTSSDWYLVYSTEKEIYRFKLK
jgi:hypothetical protein